ncbi:MAG: amidase [Caulobacter sp.]|nr:amidase [Caulobacter sp.]
MTNLTRRGLMAASAAASAVAATPAAALGWPGRKTAAAAAPAPWTPDATTVAAMIRSKEISPLEAVEAAIRRSEALQPTLNFMVNSDYDRAIDAAKKGGQTGPFAGVPFLIKDLNDYAGMPTRNGSAGSLAAPPATANDPWVDAALKAGFIVIGKSASPEFGYLPTTEPLAYGPTRNPWNTGRSTGGSSGGAAAATAAGVVTMAHASDGGGSIRIPAACCGLFGFKPSRGRLAGNTDMRVIALSVNHVDSRSVRDSAAMFAATERTDADAPYRPIGFIEKASRKKLRIGVLSASGNGREPDAEVRAGLDDAVKLLQAMGHKVSEAAWPIDSARFGQDFLTLWSAGAAMDIAAMSKALGRAPDTKMAEPFSLGMAELIAKAPEGAVDAAIGRLAQDSAAYDGWFSKFDVIVSPVLTKPPVPLGFVSGDVPFAELSARLTDYVGYTPLHNIAGAPAMSVPLHWTADGLPVGVHFAAKAGNDAILFQLAYALEQAQPWAGRKPGVSA